ncbi:MAG: hypothetical protein M3O30_04625 [Planctomycetota bacterium]|nr:hypothetical protein [Planctomycetota bacterium]
MREERGKLTGDVSVNELYTLWGMIVGTVTVIQGGKFYLRGSIYGDLVAAPGARIHIFGNVQGKLTVHPDAKVVHSGVIGGDVINRGGRIFIEHTSKIMGKVKTKDGKTTVETPAKLFEPRDRNLD